MTATAASSPRTGYALGEFQEQFAAARLWASVRRPYFAAALFAMTPIVRGGSGTASVDRAWRLYLDPCIFEQWTVEEFGAVLLHEVGHLLRDHLSRGEELVIGPSTERLWNYACDAEINDDLVAEGLPLPQPLLPRHAKLPDHLLAEEYYRRWPREPNNEDHTDCGSGVHGQTRPWELDDNDPAYERVHAWEADLIRRQVANGIRSDPGKIPAGWRRWAESTLRPTVDWKRALGSSVRRAISNVAGAVDYSYARPSRRASISPTVILPALRRPVPQIAVVCDTSGSVDDQLLGLVLAELESILRHAGAASRNVWVLACDAAVHSAQRISSTHDVQLLGGGGTDMRAGIDTALELSPRPEIIVVLTDGQTLWGSSPPRARVVIGLLGTPSLATPAWASVVRIPVDAAL